MTPPLLSRRERAIWALAFAGVAVWIVVSRFTSTDGDSGLYAQISAHLTKLPVSRWIAPEWFGLWPEANMTGWFREHPAGVFFLPSLLGRLGVPAEQGAYVVGVGAGLASLLLIGVLVARLTSRVEARAALVLLPFMPMAFVFRVRSNHEYPMLVCLLLTLVGLDGVRRGSWWWTAVVGFGLSAALVVKGVFVVFVLLAAGLWTMINPTRAGRIWRPIAAITAGIAAMVGVAFAYDALYFRQTGETFWTNYWARQLGQVTLASPMDNAVTLASHVSFYLVRLLWHPAPWSVALLVLLWQRRDALSTIRRGPWTPPLRGALFAVAFAAIAVVALSPSSRFAERYAFAATYMIGAAGSIAAIRVWPRLARLLTDLDARIPALPAMVWLTLTMLQLVLGQYLPKIS